MQVHLNAALQREIFAQMEAGYPDEAGGFLLGRLDGEQVQVLEVIQIENIFEASERHHRYEMRPEDWMRLEDEADRRGLTLVGYYHSHPDSPAIPSEYDREHALPNFVYVITSVQSGKAETMLAWRLRDDRSQFDQQTLNVGA